MNIIDRTSQAAAITTTRNGRNIFSHGRTSARRNVASLRGIIVHQTAFLSNSPERMDHIIANFVVMQDGRVLKLRDPEMMLNSIGTNQRCIDVEFVGNYPNARTIRRSHGTPLPGPPVLQVLNGRHLMKYLQQTYRLSQIFAHVQFRPKNCPGPQLWHEIGEWAHTSLGLNSVGGTPVPANWHYT